VGILEDAGFTADVPEACLLAARGCEQDGDQSAARNWALRAVELFGDQERPSRRQPSPRPGRPFGAHCRRTAPGRLGWAGGGG
jgi:hypothetical protein